MSLNILGGLQKAGGLLAAVSGLVPVLGALVNEAESLFPNAKSGAEKLSWVQKMFTNILTFAGHALTDIENITPALVSAVNTIVAAAKAPVPPAPIVK